MKKVIVVIIVSMMVLPLGLMAQDHPHGNNKNHGNMNHDNESMNHSEDQTTRMNVSHDFQKQLNDVYQASLELNNAFVTGDVDMAKTNAAAMMGKMKSVDMSLLNGDAHMAWMSYMKPINAGLFTISQSSDIDAQRNAYAGVSDGLYKSVKAFGVGETVYYQYCPMKKSSWLSDSESIKNPYYGSMMLTCGSTKEVLN